MQTHLHLFVFILYFCSAIFKNLSLLNYPMNLRIERLKTLIKWSGLSVALGTTSMVVWTSYDINQRLRKPLSTNFLNSRAEFIFIPHNYFQEPVADFLNELFEEETKIYSFLYNIKKKLTFTKVINCDPIPSCLLI